MSKYKMVNIGCGAINHSDWINLDIASDNPNVIVADIKSGLPFESSSISVCYSSHLLEHLDKSEGEVLVGECFRVLQNGGLIRIVVPDLEGIVIEYMKVLHDLRFGMNERERDYDWVMLELYDQVVRNRPGGDMIKYLLDLPIEHREFVKSRIGSEASHIWSNSINTESSIGGKPKLNLIRLQKSLRIKISRWLVKLIAGESASTAFDSSIYRDQGEIHRWMYDEYSLRRMLGRVGFVNIKTCAFNESRIPDYSKYQLDEDKGVIRKPDSIFIEAIKP